MVVLGKESPPLKYSDWEKKISLYEKQGDDFVGFTD